MQKGKSPKSRTNLESAPAHPFTYAQAMPSLVDLDAQPRVSATTAPSNYSSCVTYRRKSSCDFQITNPMEQSSLGNGNYTIEQQVVSDSAPISLDQPVCSGCGLGIRERYLLKVAEELWHETCLICTLCGSTLGNHPSCYIRDGRVYCRDDYKTIFAIKCQRCCMTIGPTEMVYKSMGLVYHVQCFSCLYCGQILQKGDQYLMVEGQLVCRHDYDIMMNGAYVTNYGLDLDATESSRKAPKRPRTILTSSQRRAFKASFEQSAKPCRKVRENLAKETGLSVRVVQVWFQNQRAKMKKIQRKHDLQKLQEVKKTGDSKTEASEADSSEKGSTKDKMDSLSKSDSGDSDVSDDESVVSEEASSPQSTNPIEKLYSMQDTYFY